MSKSKITVRTCTNGFIVEMNGDESIAKDKKELSKVIGDIFVVSIERFEEKKYLVLKLKQKQNENKTKTARFWGNFPPFNQK